MDKKTVGLSDNFKKNTAPKAFIKTPINGTKHTIAISSAKGGVGKSTFAMNFALALKSIGLKVGILDADIYGPSLPTMMSIREKPKSEDGKSMTPVNQYGVQCMSIGFLVDEETPMIWRGPMVTSAIKTFTQKVLWNDLDFIVVDMPPGTGDTQLTFAQEIKVDGVIIVSTPQKIALSDVKRGIRMFDKLKVPILGLVDNMSFFESDDGKKHNIFGEGGVEKLSVDYNKKFLGKIPINIDLRIAADSGKPLVEKDSNHKISKIFIEIAEKVKGFL
jgi:ATP-binding protein involved in chromosome partitioning